MNAEDISEAIQKAKERVRNPDAKVLLVGYSQGATNVLSYLRDANGRFGPAPHDVVGVHLLHSAARGSDVAEMLFALGRYLFSDKTPSSRDLMLIGAALGRAALRASTRAAPERACQPAHPCVRPWRVEVSDL